MMDSPRAKICMFLLNGYLQDGRVRRTTRFLAEKGYDITVIAESDTGDNDDLEIDGVKVYRLSSGGLPTSKGRFIKYLIKAALLGIRIKANIYHCFDLDTLLPAAVASTINGGNLIYEAHEYYPGLEALLGRPFTKLIWVLLERLLIHKPNKVITVNESIAEKLSKRYAIPKPTVIYSCENKRTVSKSDFIREKFNIPEDKTIILYVGILRGGQGLELIPRIISELESTAAVIVGDGPIRKRLEDLRDDLSLGDRLFFAGAVEYDELRRYYGSADIGILLMEPLAENNRLALPNKFFAYLAYGLPVVVSDIPELSRFVEDFKLGVVVQVDIDDAVEGINRIINDGDFYEKCRDNAYSFSDKFNWETEAEKYLDIYSELLDR